MRLHQLHSVIELQNFALEEATFKILNLIVIVHLPGGWAHECSGVQGFFLVDSYPQESNEQFWLGCPHDNLGHHLPYAN
jgi:hypothetical protein